MALHLESLGDWNVDSRANVAAEIPRIDCNSYLVIEARELRAVRVYACEVFKTREVLSATVCQLLLDGLLNELLPNESLDQSEARVALLLHCG